MVKLEGKRGYLRIIEAFVAIILLASVLIYFYVNNLQAKDSSDAIYKLERAILEEIASNASLRDAVLNGDSLLTTPEAERNRTLINNTINRYIQGEFNFEFQICGLNEICGASKYVNKEVFSDQISISSTLEKYDPKVIRMFVWEK
ncbi:MAG: hypothetical protein QXI33_02365 [Candidatus Pacearchaeota archaeon]